MKTIPEIKRGLRRNEFVLHYQPIINLHTGAIAGHEALIRWQCGDELIMPCDFIPEAEMNNDVMCSISKFVVRQAWIDRPLLHQGFLTVNIDPKSLERQRFWDTLELNSLIGDRPILFLEITERSLANYRIIAPRFTQYGKMAIGAAIDDFGIEYSGFIQVAKILDLFPSTEYVKVKLDIEFARNLGDPTYRWFAKAIAASMRDFPAGKIDVIAEGIEHQWQCDLLREMGVGFGQGWLWGNAKSLMEIPQ